MPRARSPEGSTQAIGRYHRELRSSEALALANLMSDVLRWWCTGGGVGGGGRVGWGMGGLVAGRLVVGRLLAGLGLTLSVC